VNARLALPVRAHVSSGSRAGKKSFGCEEIVCGRVCLEALSVDDGRSRLVVFLFRDPHLLEGGQRSENGASDPDGVFSLWWGDDLDLHGGGSESSDFLLHAVGDSGVHGGTAREYSVGVQVLSDVNIALHDGVVSSLVDTSRLHSKEGRLEEGLWAAESLVTDGDDLKSKLLFVF
jgi:hypothetical protein